MEKRLARHRRSTVSATSRVLGQASAVSAALLLAACTGWIGGDDEEAGGPRAPDGMTNPASAQPATSTRAFPLARLTRAQYTNTVRDLFAPIAVPQVAIPADITVGGFDNNTAAQTPSPALIEAYQAAASAIASQVMSNPSLLLQCSPAGRPEEDACASQFVTTFGKKAYRRALTPAEVEALVGFYTAARNSGSEFAGAMTLVLQAILQSPHFLYRVEMGEPEGGTPGSIKLSGYEMASRLSYLLLNTLPDAALMTAAETGVLSTPEGVEREARRLLADPRAHDAVAQFHAQWLRLDKIQDLKKDPGMFPSFSPVTSTALRQSAEKFVDGVFFGTGSLTTLLTDNHAYVNDLLAPIYGVTPTGSSELALVPVDATQRAGILTNAGLMAAFAHETTDSPVLRGVFVLDRIMCLPPPPPPPNIAPAPAPNAAEPKTTRERFALQHEQGACANCHKNIDGIGFGFGNYDATGKWRTTDSGFPVDASGWLPGAEDLSGTYVGAVELSKKLAASKIVHACVASQWMRYALGVDAPGLDPNAVAPIVEKFASTGLDMRELVVALVKSETFRFRKAE